MPPLHVVSDHLAHMPCPHCMKFCSQHGICHATITCSSWLPCQYQFICILPPLVINCYHHTMISWIMNTRKLSTPLPYALHSPQFLQCQYHCHHYYYYITIAILMRLPSQLQLIFQCLQHTNTSGQHSAVMTAPPPSLVWYNSCHLIGTTMPLPYQCYRIQIITATLLILISKSQC